MSKENVKGYYFITTESNKNTAEKFCKEHHLFEHNGWSTVGCCYGFDNDSNEFSYMTGVFNEKRITYSKLITFEEFRNKFLGDNIEFNKKNNYEIY